MAESLSGSEDDKPGTSAGTTAKHIDADSNSAAGSCSVLCSGPQTHITSHVKDLEDLKNKKGLFAFKGFNLLSQEDYEAQEKRQQEKDAVEDSEHKERQKQHQEHQIRLRCKNVNKWQRKHREKK